jgi:hypothetical protein
MATPIVILIGADKGGVGKTTGARTLLDYFTVQQISTRAFDTEAPKGALHRFHPKITEIVDAGEISGQMRIFDTVSDSTVTVIDVRAGLLSSTLRTLRNIDFLDSAKKGQLTFVVFHVLGSSASRRVTHSFCAVIRDIGSARCGMSTSASNAKTLLPMSALRSAVAPKSLRWRTRPVSRIRRRRRRPDSRSW